MTSIGWLPRAAAPLLIIIILLACSNPTGTGGTCEVIYITSESDPTASTGIQIENALSGGLHATVESERHGDYGADMAPGACEVWGFPAGTYGVALQRCEQGEAGNTTCTRLLGAEVRRTVTVEQGTRTRLRVDAGLFGGS